MQRRRVILAIIALIIVLSILIWIGYKLVWTGFSNKTLWDWMQLLIIPAILAGGAYWLNESARHREQAVTEQRAETERNIAADNRQEAALQTYLDRMAELFLDKKLRKSEENSEVRAVARARTLTVLQRLDKDRKGALLRFLHETDLINKDKTVINLSGADLTEANLTETNLSGANLIGADLRWANLIKANLIGADLRWANLIKANLIGAELIGADLYGANLIGADLSRAKYTKNNADLPDTIWPEGFDPDAAGAILIKV